LVECSLLQIRNQDWARDVVLVKQVRLGKGGFILTVVPVGDDRARNRAAGDIDGRDTLAQNVAMS